MDDLISRQAAKNKKVYSEERHEYVVPVAELDWLPSAQPDIARDIATIIENEQDMRVILKNERTETHSCDYQRTETHDLVSRGAALEAMDTWDKFGCDPDGKLVRYDDDKHYVPYVHYEDMVHAVKNLPSVQPQRWIPVSEAVPEPDERVAVTTGGYEYHVWDCMSNRDDDYFWEDEEGYYHNKYAVVAWMPLPPVYEGGQDE